VTSQITASIGIADLIQHGGDVAGLLRQADWALYAAKAAGRNCTVVAPIGAGLTDPPTGSPEGEPTGTPAVADPAVA